MRKNRSPPHIGARTPDQLEANLASLDVELDALSERQLDYPHDVPEP